MRSFLASWDAGKESESSSRGLSQSAAAVQQESSEEWSLCTRSLQPLLSFLLFCFVCFLFVCFFLFPSSCFGFCWLISGLTLPPSAPPSRSVRSVASRHLVLSCFCNHRPSSPSLFTPLSLFVTLCLSLPPSLNRLHLSLNFFYASLLPSHY